MADTDNSPAVRDHHAVMEAVITKGDLGKLTPEEKWQYYSETCRSIGLNPLTKPFDYLTLSGKTVLYATKSCTDQLRSIRGISVTKVDARTEGDMRIVEVYATDSTGRQDMDMGVTTVKGLTGDALANAYMKALTKAKRRVTLSLCGLGMLDESEIETIPGAHINADPARLTGSITPEGSGGRAGTGVKHIYDNLTDRAVAATANRDQEAWKALVAEVGKDVDLWPALIAQSPSETHLAWLEKAANGKGQQLRPHFDRRRADLTALIEAGDADDADNRPDEDPMPNTMVLSVSPRSGRVDLVKGFAAATPDDDAEYDPATGERIPDWVGKVAATDQLAGMPTTTRGRTADQIAGVN
ncbi:hypothetical protein [Nocardioides sp.]|uniref:hypothetical protein n=1 Tax=Nocardioides sp. TaxID=35761 RepID=UPI002C6E9D4B|nr:hypothetical protein [Nocardioides sp.]HXH79555.1 hypothetical protein [Nocardioides sp.]